MRKVSFIKRLNNIISGILLATLLVWNSCSLQKRIKNSIVITEEKSITSKEFDTIKAKNIEAESEPLYHKPSEWQGLFFVVLEKADFLKSNGYNLYLCKKENWKTTPPDLQWSLENHRVRVEKIQGETLVVEQVLPDSNNEWEIIFVHLKESKKIYGYTHKQSLSEVVLLKDLELAQKRWKGKTIFSKRGIISVIERKEPFSLTTKKIKFSDSLTVKEVKAGMTPLPVKPIWLIVKTKEGIEGIIPVRYSWTNTIIEQIKGGRPWEEDIFEYDPTSFYKWEKDIWELIDNHRVIIDMLEEQVKLSWGEPDSIFTESKENIKIWHYPSHLIVFSNGKVISIKEKK